MKFERYNQRENAMKRIIICMATWIVIATTVAYGQSLFQTPQLYPVGGPMPWAIASGHFNMDTYYDLTAVGYTDGSNGFVGVLLGTGSGNFGAASSYSATGSYPENIATGDFNEDGYSDIVITRNGPDDIRIWLATGSGGFGTPNDLFSGGYFAAPYAIAVGDFNHDDHLDLAVTDDQWNFVQILRGDGNGNFTDLNNYTGLSSPKSICTGFFNGDSHLDLAVANRTGSTVSILLGQGNGNFQNPVSYDTWSSPWGMTCGDFNEDGFTDIVTSHRNGNQLTILLGTGTGSFGSPDNISIGSPQSIVAADFNHDDHLDLAVGCGYGGNNIILWFGAGDGTFPINDSYASGGVWITSIISGDYNSDGLPDLAMTNRDSEDFSVLLSVSPPAQVTGVSATEGLCDSVVITWDDVSDETGYKIYRDAVEVGIAGADVTTYTDTPSPGAYDYTVSAYNGAGEGMQSDPDEGTRLDCTFPYAELDMGDLSACDYPTLMNNPAHGLSGVAWLGENITGETAPNTLDIDGGDDGVIFIGLPWMPCSAEEVTVTVTVTGGPNYARYASLDGQLFLNGWKDGNLDGDFCDVLCDGTAPEWIIQDQPIVPGEHSFSFLDPGDPALGQPRYDGIFRFRLTSTAVGSEGFGLMDAESCPSMSCGTFAVDSVGEVEDYIVPDAQLDVELSSFDAVATDNSITIQWTTASEINNDRFEVLRDNDLAYMTPSQGNTAAGHTYEWVDTDVRTGTIYSYTLIAVDINGDREVLATASSSPGANGTVTDYALHQNYPNPFNPTTSITFDLVESGNVNLRVYDLMGREVALLVDGLRDAGHHTVTFDATGLPSGLYLLQMETSNFLAQRKMVLLK